MQRLDNNIRNFPDSPLSVVHFVYNALLDFVFPPSCILCHTRIKDGKEFLCRDCMLSLPLLPAPFKQVCELSKPPQPPVWFESSLAVYQYTEDVKTLVHLFKYRKTPQLAVFFGESLGRQISAQPDILKIDALAPVPLHSSRYRERGYNQSALLAREISQITHIPVDEDLLKRDVRTQPQAETKSRKDRVKNVRGAFSVKQGKLVQAGIAVVDDVVTTGSTINECARVLRNAGAERVIAISISRVE